MIRAIIRFLIVSFITFLDGLCLICFENQEIVQMLFVSKPITKPVSEEQKILVNYLKKCQKQVYKGENERKRNKKEIDTKTD